MNIIDIINKKRLNKILNDSEIEYVVNSYLNDEIKDYQMSSLLMAICLNGMTDEEIITLTKCMVDSGEKLDLSKIKNVVDKHSTGGVGDKTTLVVSSIAASLGCKVAKMSGRSLGFTGGTIDKLESIPGFKTKLTEKNFINQIKKNNFAITSQTGNLVPADKKIYALRDVTGTVESIPLIASSIMSKKIASGAKKLVIDLKVGKGALIKNENDALTLAKLMKKIGETHNIDVVCVITNMDNPLGFNIGNSLEIKEVIDVLTLKGEENLTKLCLELGAQMVMLGLNIDENEARIKVKESLESGIAYQKFKEIVELQNGQLELLEEAKYKTPIKSKQSGFIFEIDAYKIGNFCMKLGAGRINKDLKIDYTVGMVLKKTINDYVKTDEEIAIVHSNRKLTEEEINEVLEAFSFSSKKQEIEIIKKII